MTTFNFKCTNPDCKEPITALVQQGGMTINCQHCGASNEIPSIAVPDVAQSPRPTPNRNVSDQLKEYGTQTLLNEMGPLGNLIGNKQKKESPPLEEKRKPSLIDRLYTAAGAFFDKQLAGETEENSFKGKLQSLRLEYLKLSDYRRRHIAFFISLLLVFLVITLISFSAWSGIAFALIYASFVALNQIKILNSFFSWITEIVVAVTIFFLPEAVKDLVSSLIKYIVFVLIVISFGKYVGPAYILYKGALVALDKQEA